MTEEGQRSMRFLDSISSEAGSEKLSAFCRVLNSLFILLIVGTLLVASPLYATDTDSDGVPDTHDDYPSDAQKVRDLPASLSAIGSKLAVWIDASSSKNYELDSNYINQAYDLSGNGHHPDMDNTGRRPTYHSGGNLGTTGLETFEFNDDYFKLPDTATLGIQNSEYEFIMVGRNTRSSTVYLTYSGSSRYYFRMRDRRRLG